MRSKRIDRCVRCLLGAILLAGSSMVFLTAASAPGEDDPKVPTKREPTRIEPDQFDIARDWGEFAKSSRRHITVWPGEIHEVVGNDRVWEAKLPKGCAASLADIAALVAKSPHENWVKEVEPGVIQVNVAITQRPKTRLTFAAPRVREVRLLNRPDVYLSGWRATARFKETKVTSWNPKTGKPATDPTKPRPFISYAGGGSRLDISKSELGYLGSDRVMAYGVSWGEGSTGSSVGSTYHHGFFGGYSNGAAGVVFRDNVFRDNFLYGLDPHTASRDLTVVGNEAYGNGKHGIIFSKDVTDSIVYGNNSHDNAGNGIMMDERCDRNIVAHNVSTDNEGDGIVVQGSSDVSVTGNTVARNRDGIRVNGAKGEPSDDTEVSDNEVVDNQRGIESFPGEGGVASLRLSENEVNGSTKQGILIEAKDASSKNDSVDGARVGFEVRSEEVSVSKLSVANAKRGVDIVSGGSASIKDADLDAHEVGIATDRPANMKATGSDISARKPVVGAELDGDLGNSLHTPRPQLTWLAVAGAMFVLLALVLHIGHHARCPMCYVRHKVAPKRVRHEH